MNDYERQNRPETPQSSSVFCCKNSDCEDNKNEVSNPIEGKIYYCNSCNTAYKYENGNFKLFFDKLLINENSFYKILKQFSIVDAIINELNFSGFSGNIENKKMTFTRCKINSMNIESSTIFSTREPLLFTDCDIELLNIKDLKIEKYSGRKKLNNLDFYGLLIIRSKLKNININNFSGKISITDSLIYDDISIKNSNITELFFSRNQFDKNIIIENSEIKDRRIFNNIINEKEIFNYTGPDLKQIDKNELLELIDNSKNIPLKNLYISELYISDKFDKKIELHSCKIENLIFENEAIIKEKLIFNDCMINNVENIPERFYRDVQFKGCIFNNDFILENTQFDRKLILDQSTFKKNVTLLNLTFEKGLHHSNIYVENNFIISSCINRWHSVGNYSCYKNKIDISKTNVEGQLELEANLTGTIMLDDITINQSLFLRSSNVSELVSIEYSKIAKETNLSEMYNNGNLSIYGSKFNEFFFCKYSKINKEVNLNSIFINIDFNYSFSDFNSSISIINSIIEGTILDSGCYHNDQYQIINLEIGDCFLIFNSIFQKELSYDNVFIKKIFYNQGNIYYDTFNIRYISCASLESNNSMFYNDTEFFKINTNSILSLDSTKAFSDFKINSCNIKDDLTSNNSEFHKNFDFISNNLGNMLLLNDALFKKNCTLKYSSVENELQLQNAIINNNLLIETCTLKSHSFLTNMKISGDINIDDCKCIKSISLKYSISDGNINITSSELSQELYLNNLKVNKNLEVKHCQIDKQLQLKDSFINNDLSILYSQVNNMVFLKNIDVNGNYSIISSKLTEIDSANSKIKGNLLLKECNIKNYLLFEDSNITGNCELTQLNIVQNLYASRSKINGIFNVSYCNIGESVYIDKINVQEECVFLLNSIKNCLDSSKSQYNSLLKLNTNEIMQECFFNNVIINNNFIINETNVNSGFYMKNSIIKGCFNMELSNIAGTLNCNFSEINEYCNISHSNIGSQLYMKSINVNRYMRLNDTQIESWAFFNDSDFHDDFVLYFSHFKKDLEMINVKFGRKFNCKDNKIDGIFIINNTAFLENAYDIIFWNNRFNKFMLTNSTIPGVFLFENNIVEYSLELGGNNEHYLNKNCFFEQGVSFRNSLLNGKNLFFCDFKGTASFYNTQFIGETHFDKSEFHQTADFTTCYSQNELTFNSVNFHEILLFDQAFVDKRIIFDNAFVPYISFKSAIFKEFCIPSSWEMLGGILKNKENKYKPVIKEQERLNLKIKSGKSNYYSYPLLMHYLNETDNKDKLEDFKYKLYEINSELKNLSSEDDTVKKIINYLSILFDDIHLGRIFGQDFYPIAYSLISKSISEEIDLFFEEIDNLLKTTNDIPENLTNNFYFILKNYNEFIKYFTENDSIPKNIKEKKLHSHYCHEAIEDQYLSMKNIYGNNGELHNEDKAYFQWMKHKNLRESIENPFYLKIINLFKILIFQGTFGWGVNLFRLAISTIIIILTFSGIYWFAYHNNPNIFISYDDEDKILFQDISLPEVILLSSQATFSVFLGDWAPVGSGSMKIWMTIQTVLGILIVTFLIGAYGRKMLR